MNIIIAGAGKVGFNLAKTLSIGHNVTIIDKNKEALHRIQESLDILPLSGDVEDSTIYEHFVTKSIDLFIAVTNVDNVNLVATLMADAVLTIDKKIVRIKNHFYGDTLVQEKLDIYKFIYPIKLTSETIASLLEYPMANNVKFFNYTDQRLISIRAVESVETNEFDREKVALVGIERDKRFFIPMEHTLIECNDLVYFFGLEEDIQEVCHKLEKNHENLMQNCVVFGADELGTAITKELLNANKSVKLIERNLALCEAADEALEGKASVIYSKYGIETLFEDEGLENADIFISATDNDEYNIAKCLEAREKGIQKVMAINNEMEYYSLMHSLGIIVVRGTKMSAYNKIMEEISSNGVVLEKSYCGSKANIQMRKFFADSPYIGKIVKAPKVTHSQLFFLRNEKLQIWTQSFQVEENDVILAFCESKESTKVKQWIYEL